MRSIVKTQEIVDSVLDQQFELAKKIHAWELMPIVEPEVPIEHEHKQGLEIALLHGLKKRLDEFDGKCILKLTLPEQPNMYKDLIGHKSVHAVVGLSGGYSTEEACRRLAQNDNMTASFSRALSEGLFHHQTDVEFDMTLSMNIKDITEAST
jgi:fructose-bisphosphate aldolase class I